MTSVSCKQSALKFRGVSNRGFPTKSKPVNVVKVIGGEPAIEDPNPWVVTSTSWTCLKIVEITDAEACIIEDQFVAECMELFCRWTLSAEFGPFNYSIPSSSEEIMLEPETQDTRLVAARPSFKSLLPAPSDVFIHSMACSILSESLVRSLFSSHPFNPLVILPSPSHWILPLETTQKALATLPSPPHWMLEHAEMNSLVSTVSLPSNWDAISARLSSSSIFNLFSDRPASPALSIFNIDPTGVSTGSTVSIPSNFFDAVHPDASSASTLFVDPSEVSSTDSFLMDPSSALSPYPYECYSMCSISSSPSISDLILRDSLSHHTLLSSSSSSHRLHCSECGFSHSVTYSPITVTDSCVSCHGVTSPSSSDEFERSRHTFIVSKSDDEGYESDVDSAPIKKTTTVSTQTGPGQLSAVLMLEKCDDMIEKIVEMKKNLMKQL